MKGVTIDKLDLKDHVRWAQDQEVLDMGIVLEASVVAPHPKIYGMSTIYSSKFEELFELQKRNQHWACFTPPQNFQLFRKRFFSYRLFPHIDCEITDEDANSGDTEDRFDDAERESDSEKKAALENDLMTLLGQIKAFNNQTSTLFEKDKNAITTLIESIQWINKLLKQINARKLQYQKG